MCCVKFVYVLWNCEHFYCELLKMLLSFYRRRRKFIMNLLVKLETVMSLAAVDEFAILLNFVDGV